MARLEDIYRPQPKAENGHEEERYPLETLPVPEVLEGDTTGEIAYRIGVDLARRRFLQLDAEKNLIDPSKQSGKKYSETLYEHMTVYSDLLGLAYSPRVLIGEHREGSTSDDSAAPTWTRVFEERAKGLLPKGNGNGQKQ